MTWSAQDFALMEEGVKAIESLSMPSSPLNYNQAACLLYPLIEAVNRLADNVGGVVERLGQTERALVDIDKAINDLPV